MKLKKGEAIKLWL